MGRAERKPLLQIRTANYYIMLSVGSVLRLLEVVIMRAIAL